MLFMSKGRWFSWDKSGLSLQQLEVKHVNLVRERWLSVKKKKIFCKEKLENKCWAETHNVHELRYLDFSWLWTQLPTSFIFLVFLIQLESSEMVPTYLEVKFSYQGEKSDERKHGFEKTVLNVGECKAWHLRAEFRSKISSSVITAVGSWVPNLSLQWASVPPFIKWG